MTTQTDWTKNLPHQKGATGMTYNTLKLDQQLEFVEFLKNHSYPDGTSIKTIADDATRDLGFVVTENNVRTTAKAAKIELPAARVPKVDPMDALLARIDSLEKRFDSMEARWATAIELPPEVMQQLLGTLPAVHDKAA